MVCNEKSQTKSKEIKPLYDIKKWKETFIAREMSSEEREWYIHWMTEYNKQRKRK